MKGEATPAIAREPLFHLKEEATAEGYPLVAVYGEQGPQVAGWLDRYEPRWAEGLHQGPPTPPKNPKNFPPPIL